MVDGYSICFNEWALDKDIKSELGLLLIISSLTAEKGYCFASNKYLANLFEIDEVSVSRKISKLEKKKYINLEYEKRGNQIINRKIRLTKMLTDGLQKSQPTDNKNVNGLLYNNITNVNNISNNIYSTSKAEQKHKYGEFKNVLLTDVELQKLNKDFGEEKTQRAIKYLDEAIEMKGYKYKSHYLAMRKWVFEALDKNIVKGKNSDLSNAINRLSKYE